MRLSVLRASEKFVRDVRPHSIIITILSAIGASVSGLATARSGEASTTM